MLFIKIPCHLWPRPKFFPISEPISTPSLRSHYYKQWVHACFNWFEWNYSTITSLLLLMPYSKKSLYFWVAGCFPSLSFTNVNSWWVVYRSKEWVTRTHFRSKNTKIYHFKSAAGTNHASPLLWKCWCGFPWRWQRQALQGCCEVSSPLWGECAVGSPNPTTWCSLVQLWPELERKKAEVNL